MITSHYRGHKIIYTDKWTFADGSKLCEVLCKRCGKMPTAEGHDSCLGHIDGVTAACCGHGVEIQYKGVELVGENTGAE